MLGRSVSLTNGVLLNLSPSPINNFVLLPPYVNKDTTTPKDKVDMVAELNVMKSLKPHPHVLKLIGCCTFGGKSFRETVC